MRQGDMEIKDVVRQAGIDMVGRSCANAQACFRRVAYPRVFCAKSLESLETKRVEFFVSAKRGRKNVKRKNLNKAERSHRPHRVVSSRGRIS